MLTPSNRFYAQVQLLVRVLPTVARERCFALKGGTAINLFVRDMPRLSVDIDLAYLPLSDRATALRDIDAAMNRIKASLESGAPAYQVREAKHQEGCVYGLSVGSSDAEIKIEVTPVLRGSVYSPSVRRIAASAESAFGFAEMQLLSFEDIYAGKLVAALDRQHPRDLFDVKFLLANEGISDDLFKAFLVYLISHDGSIGRLLGGASKPLAELFDKQFVGMPVAPVTLEDLERARSSLLREIHAKLGDVEKRFLLSFKRGDPDWGLLGVQHAPKLPAVRWKLQNLDRMDTSARVKAVSDLEALLNRIKP